MNSLVDLLDSVRTHLAAFELPALWSVDVTASAVGPKVNVQLDCHRAPEVADGLLAWVDTLSEVTVEAWRVPSGDSVHLLVIGRLSDGATVRVYGAVPFTGLDVGVDLAPDARTTIPLTVLRAMATLGEAIL
jgi:hypothetical protein